MSFADFQDSVPPVVRLLLAVTITVGVSLLFVHLFHRQILELNAPPTKDNDDDPDPPPGVKDLSGRLIALTTFAFVFLLGFGFSQFWGTAKDARDAAFNEAVDYQRAVGAAARLPEGQTDPVMRALEDYRLSVIDTEWPLMRAADSTPLANARYEAGITLSDSLADVRTAEDASDPAWSQFSGSVDDLLDDAIDRTNALPSPMAVSVIALVLVLGIANLVAIALFQPAHKKAHLILVALMAAITGLMLFALVELANPYNGAGAVTSLLQR